MSVGTLSIPNFLTIPIVPEYKGKQDDSKNELVQFGGYKSRYIFEDDKHIGNILGHLWYFLEKKVSD